MELATDAAEIARDYDQGWRPFSCRAGDGLELAGRDYGYQNTGETPLVCLPGLTRNSKDFHSLATYFASRPERARRILTLDFRGRGRSGYDGNIANYAPPVEMADTQTALSAAGISRAIFVGTSRGGLVGMILAATAPQMVAGLILNDVGPALDVAGLKRIAGYVREPFQPSNWEDAVAAVRQVNADQFTDLSVADWLRFAVQIYRMENGRPVLDYDAAVGKGVADLDLDAPIPDIWPVYDALAAIPMMAIRGENSDLLSPQTFDEMDRRHTGLTRHTVANQGHAPLLWDDASQFAISNFVDGISG